MHAMKLFAILAASLAAVLLSASAALAAGTTVTVRIEGLQRTLLSASTVTTRAGSITKAGAAKGKCPATSAQGALDVATHHDWRGTWYASYGEYLITSILGESYGSKSSDYWSVWVDDRFAQIGACDIKLHRGDQVLFAVEGKKTALPIALRAPTGVRAGQPFTVEVVSFNEGGHSSPLAGARVTAAGINALTDAHGKATITAASTGTLVLAAQRTGYIRAATVRVHVSA
jgi:Domain of unknown function (DUF4430)